MINQNRLDNGFYENRNVVSIKNFQTQSFSSYQVSHLEIHCDLTVGSSACFLKAFVLTAGSDKTGGKSKFLLEDGECVFWMTFVTMLLLDLSWDGRLDGSLGSLRVYELFLRPLMNISTANSKCSSSISSRLFLTINGDILSGEWEKVSAVHAQHCRRGQLYFLKIVLQLERNLQPRRRRGF